MPYEALTARILVDPARNKTLVKSRTNVPLFGAADSNLLFDYTTRGVIKSIPFLGVCEDDYDFSPISDLKSIIDSLFDPLSDVTTYLGEDKAPWDATQTYWHFTHKNIILENFSNFLDTYWDKQSGELKWVSLSNTQFVA
jgi:hypothetical protein